MPDDSVNKTKHKPKLSACVQQTKNNHLVVVDEHLIGTQIGLYHGHLKHDIKLD